MNTIESIAISLPKEEFIETFQTIKELLALEVDPRKFIVADPFLFSSSPKVDLRRHLQSLFDGMQAIRQRIEPAKKTVTINFD